MKATFTRLSTALLFGAALAQAAPQEALVDSVPPALAVLADVPIPAGWDAEAGPEGAKDPSMTLSRAGDVIRVRLFGGPGTRFKTPKDFLKSPAATTMGKPPQKDAVVAVSGVRTFLYRHAYPEAKGDPSARSAGAPRMIGEEFCIVPAGKKFLVLGYAEEGVPDPEGSGRKAWQSFLKAFKLKK